MRKRLTALLLLCTLLIFPFAGCKKDGFTVPPKKDIRVDETYRIVYAAKADEITLAAVSILQRALNKTGLKTVSVTDEETEQDNEILVGLTSRTAAEIPEKAGIGTDRSKILISAPDSETLYLFVSHLCRNWIENSETVALTKENHKTLNEWSAPQKITVLSQNVRCADDGGNNDIDDREGRLKQLIDDTAPDLIGTQEVTNRWKGILKNYFEEDYTLIGCSRDGQGETSGEWNLILIKKERFEVLSSGTFWLTDTSDTPSMTPDAKCRRICTWAKLKDKQSGEELVFANTHLDHSTDTVRDAQAKILMEKLRSLSGDLPLFLTGDFNAKPDSAPYKTITKDYADARREAVTDRSDIHYTFHNYKSTGSSEIDFCFYKADKATALTAKIQNQSYDGFVSDHYGVLAEFYLK